MRRQKRLVQMFWVSWSLSVIKGEEVLKGLVLILLVLSLERLSFGRIKDLHVVFAIHFNSLTLVVLLVESFVKSFLVGFEKSSVMHDFNG